MIHSRRLFVAALFGTALAPGLTASGRTLAHPRAQRAARPAAQWVVPAGFQVTTFAENVENARSLALGSGGTVFVRSRLGGKVHAVVDRDGDHKPDRVVVIMSVGAPCNVCLSPPLVSAIVRMRPDGSNLETFAEGIPSSLGFDWHPTSRELWFTDNGRDALGDDLPGDELNVAWKPGLHFGFPFCHQGNLTDPQFGAQRGCATTEPPARVLDAHVAAIGMTFYTGTMFPAEYRNAVFVAEHGSWNRSKLSGYRAMVARTDGRRVTSYEPFLDGFMPNRASAPGGWAAQGAAAGRPTCCSYATARS